MIKCDLKPKIQRVQCAGHTYKVGYNNTITYSKPGMMMMMMGDAAVDWPLTNCDHSRWRRWSWGTRGRSILDCTVYDMCFSKGILHEKIMGFKQYQPLNMVLECDIFFGCLMFNIPSNPIKSPFIGCLMPFIGYLLNGDLMGFIDGFPMSLPVDAPGKSWKVQGEFCWRWRRLIFACFCWNMLA